MIMNLTELKVEKAGTTEPDLLAGAVLRISSAWEVSWGTPTPPPDDSALLLGTPQAGRARVQVHRVGFSAPSLQPALLCRALPLPSHRQHPVRPAMEPGPIVRSFCHTVASCYENSRSGLLSSDQRSCCCCSLA